MYRSYNLDSFLEQARERGILVRFPETTDIDVYEEQFENLIQYDIRTNCNPLILYERNNNPVAFYDVTTLEGFILTPSTIEHKN
jgi:hypothetical protein